MRYKVFFMFMIGIMLQHFLLLQGMKKINILFIVFTCLIIKADSIVLPVRPNDTVWSHFCYLLDKMPVYKAEILLKDIFECKMNDDDYTYLAYITERYLHYQDSPCRNDNLYIYVMDIVTKSPSIGLADRVRYVENLEMAKRNRVGSRALDFEYNVAGGKSGHLYGIKAKYLLILFYNPDCDVCSDLFHKIESSSDISHKAKLAVFHGNDLMLKLQTYDMSMVPTLYLLDENKIVLLKNATLDEVEHYLHKVR